MSMSFSAIPTKSAINNNPSLVEYKVVECETLGKKALTELGQSGWIFAYVFTSDDKNQFLFF